MLLRIKNSTFWSKSRASVPNFLTYLIISMMVIVMLLTMVIMVVRMTIMIMVMVMMMSVLDKHVLGGVANLVNPPPTSSTGKHDD